MTCSQLIENKRNILFFMHAYASAVSIRKMYFGLGSLSWDSEMVRYTLGIPSWPIVPVRNDFGHRLHPKS